MEFFVAVERDITKEREVDKAKIEFVSLASHQLRTPLSSINWYTEMLIAGDAGKTTQKQKKFLEEIYRGSKRMVDLVNSLLNVSRLELGTFMITPQQTSLADLATAAVKELDPLVKNRHQSLSVSIDPKLPALMIDPKLTTIIFQNLLSNAVKYTSDGGSIQLDVSQKDSDVLIKVTDTGLGIPDAQKGQIFTKLFRADNVRETDTEGTGLGLYLVKSILDATGGKVWFDSTVGKGSTFYATIPLSGMKLKEGIKELA